MNSEINTNNNILLKIVKSLNKLKDYTIEKFYIEILNDVIIKINYIIRQNKKNIELLKNYMSYMSLMNKSINRINKDKKELIREDGKYIGQVVNGLAEGKGIAYFKNGDRYEGEWKNNKEEGKGIYYFKNGDRYEGDFKNNKADGKGIFYWNDGDIYEGD